MKPCLKQSTKKERKEKQKQNTKFYRPYHNYINKIIQRKEKIIGKK
jgi:predicted N-formylglutamate amidohydrolase